MKQYMEVINRFFERCESETFDMMKQNSEDFQAARKNEYVTVEYESELFGKKEKRSYETWLFNHREYKEVAGRSRSVYMKGQSVYKYEPKPEFKDSLTEEQQGWFDSLNFTQKIKAEIIERYPVKMIEFVLSPSFEKNESSTKEYVHKFFEQKKQDLLQRIENKGGAIKDAIEIHEHWQTGELNGKFDCESGIVKIQTIFAGGYNIQCLHIRNLIHLLK